MWCKAEEKGNVFLSIFWHLVLICILFSQCNIIFNGIHDGSLSLTLWFLTFEHNQEYLWFRTHFSKFILDTDSSLSKDAMQSMGTWLYIEPGTTFMNAFIEMHNCVCTNNLVFNS